MSVIIETEKTIERFKSQIVKLKEIMKNYEINSIKELVKSVRHKKEFRNEWINIWKEIAEAEGGKLSLTTLGLIIGSLLGGVGIAGVWGAFGLPLVFVLGLGGFVMGTEIDTIRKYKKKKLLTLMIPKNLYDRINHEAERLGLKKRELIIHTLEGSFPEDGKSNH